MKLRRWMFVSFLHLSINWKSIRNDVWGELLVKPILGSRKCMRPELLLKVKKLSPTTTEELRNWRLFLGDNPPFIIFHAAWWQKIPLNSLWQIFQALNIVFRRNILKLWAYFPRNTFSSSSFSLSRFHPRRSLSRHRGNYISIKFERWTNST